MKYDLNLGQPQMEEYEFMMETETQSKIKNFKIVRQIGEGSYAKVFLIVDTDTGFYYACKAMSLELFRVSHEVDIAHRLEHPRICKLYFTITSRNFAYLIMEYVKGQTIQSAVDDDFYSMSLYEVCREIAEGLSYMHDERVYHRDLKPSNVMISDEGHVKIIDFGFSRTCLSDKASTVCGNFATMAPEVFSGSYSPSKSDVWSCGLLFFYIANRRYPFSSIAPGEESFVYGSLSGREGHVSVPQKYPVQQISTINRLVDMMMRVNPNSRMTMSEVLNYLSI